jgi:16S rRNA (guanine966-N2)-methyltransferase
LPKQPRHLKLSTLRIIGGQWRGRKLSFTEVTGLRPTGDRIRETLFNWLAPNIAGARCLDLFAGTGSLGLECLSRGATQVWLLEKHAHAAAILANNLKVLDAKHGKLIKTDSLQWLLTRATETISTTSIDIVFIDPPFEDQLWEPAVEGLEAANILAVDARLYIETPRQQTIRISPQWALLREKKAGNVCYRLYQRKQ